MSTKKKKPRRVHDIVFDNDDDDDDTEATRIQNFSYSDGGKSLEIDNYSSDSSDLEDIFSGIRKVPTYGELERRSMSTVCKKKQPAKMADSPRKSVFSAKTFRKPAETQQKDNGMQPKLMPFGSSAGSSSRVTKPMSQTKHSHTQHKAPADTPVIDISSDEEPPPQRKRAKVYVQSTLSHCLTTKGKRTIQKPPIEDESSTDSFELAPIDTTVKKGVALSKKVQSVISDSSDSTIMGGNSPVYFEDEEEESPGEAKTNGRWNFMKFTPGEVKDKVPDFDLSEDSCSQTDVNDTSKIQEVGSTSDTDCNWEPLRLSQNRKGVRREGLDIVICETDNDDDETQDPNAESDRTLVPEPSPVNTSHQLHRKTERRKSEETTSTTCQVPSKEPIVYSTIDYSDDSSSDGEWLIKPSQTHTPRLLTKGTPPMRNPSQIIKPSQEKVPRQNNYTKQSTLLSSQKPYGRKSPVLHKETNANTQNQATRAVWKESCSDKDDNDDSEREGIFSYIRKLHQNSPKKPIPGVLRKQVSDSTSDDDCVMKEKLATFTQGKKTFSSSFPLNVPKTSTPNASPGPLLGHRVDAFNLSEDTEAYDDLPITNQLKSRYAKKRAASPVFGKSKKNKPDHVQDESVGKGPLVTVNPNMGDRYHSSHGNQSMSGGDTKKGLSNLSQPEEQNRQDMWTYSGQESTSDHLPFTTRKEVQMLPAVDLTEDEETQDPNLTSDNEDGDAGQVSAATGLNEDSKEGLLPFIIKGPGDDKDLNESEDSREGLLPFIIKGPGDDKDLNESEDSREGLLPFIIKGPGDDKDLNESEDSREGLLPFIIKGPGDDKDLIESEDSREALLPFIKKEPSDDNQQEAKASVSFSIKKEPADDDQQEAKADFSLAFTQADVYVIDSDDDGDDSFAALSQSFVQFPIKEESEEEDDQELSEVIFIDPWNADIINTSVMANEQSAVPVAIKQEKEEEDLSESLYLTQKAVQEAMNSWSDDETYVPDVDGELTKLAANGGEGWSDCDDDLLLSLDIEPAKASSPTTVQTEQKPTPSVTASVKENQQTVKLSTPTVTNSDLAKYLPVKYRKIELSDEEGDSTNKPNVTIAPQQAGLLSRAKNPNAPTEKSPNHEAEVDLTQEILTQIFNESMEMDSQIVLSDEEDVDKTPILCAVDDAKDLSRVTETEINEVVREGMPQNETKSDTVSSLPSAHTVPALKPQATLRFSVDPKVHQEIEKVEKSPEPFVDGVSQVEYADNLTDEQLQSYLSAKYTSSSPNRPAQSEPPKTQHEPIVISDDDNKVDQHGPSLSVKDNKSENKEVAIDLTEEVKVSNKSKDRVEKEVLKAHVTKDMESRKEQEATHKSRDQHPSSKGARDDTKSRSRSESRSPVECKEGKDHNHEAPRKEEPHKSSSKSSTIEEGDKKKTGREEIKRKQPHASSSSHTKDKRDEEKYKDTKSRSSSKLSEDIKKQSEKKHVGSSCSSKSDKDRTHPHSTTSRSSTTSSKDDRRKDDRKSSHADISKDKKEPTKSKERSSSSSRSSHTSKTVHRRESKDSRSNSSTSRSKSKSPKPHSKHESSSTPKESDRTKLNAKEKPSTSAAKNPKPSSKDESSSKPQESDRTKLDAKEKPSTSTAKNPKLSSKVESSSKPKECDRTKLHSREKPSTSTTDESDEGIWMSVINKTPVVAQNIAKLLGKSTEVSRKDLKVSPPESSKVPSAAVAKFQARMRGNHVPVQKPSKSSRSKKRTRIVAPSDDNLISMTQSIEIAKVNMYERAQRAREERQRNKEIKPVTNPSAHEKKSSCSSSHDRSKSWTNNDDTSVGIKGKPNNRTAQAQTTSSKEDKNAKPSTSKHSSNSDKSKVSSSHQSTSSSCGKKDATVAKAIDDITESFRNLSQSQSQSHVETSNSSNVAVQPANNSTTVKSSNVATNSTVPKSSEIVNTSTVTSSSSSTSAETAAASTSSAVSPVDEPTVKKRRINLPVASVCSSTVPGTFRSIQQDPYELLKAMPALTIGDSGKNLTVDDFLNVVLQWIPKWMDEMDAQEGTAGPKPLPPFMNVAASGPSALLKSDTLWPVPDTFENAREYFEIMLGHILHEVWSATYSDWRRSKNRPTMGSFIPVSKDPTNTMFHTLIFQGLVVRNQQVPVSEGDLVIVHMKSVRRDGSPSGTQLVFGYVQRTEKTEPCNPQQLHPKLGNFQWVRNTKRMVVSVTIRFFYRILPDNDFMDIQVVTSLISVLRQIGALIAFPRNLLSHDLLQPTRLKTFLPTEGREDKNLDKLYNSSQVRVINSVVASLLQPFVVPRVSLIQGPPGTGKSHTILAIIRNTIFRKTADGRTPCLMLCAPSNAAIDELVRRVSIENDIRKKQGNEMVRVVRIGSQASMSENSRQYSLDTKVKEAWENRKLLEKMKTMPMSIRKEMLAVHEQLPGLRVQLEAARKAKAAEQVRKLEQDIDMLEKKEAKFKDTGKRNEPTARDTSQLRYEVLAHAHIVACTLNSAGSRIIADAVSFGQAQALNPSYKGPRFQFTGVLIDEACQCVEVEALIPLQYCATKLVLIGDPQQLPPTVISQDAETMKFSQSLFERLYNHFRMKSYSAVFLLDTQYRMHPEIAVFPSRHVYDGRLKTDPGLAEKRSLFPFRHYFVFDLVYGREQSDQRSLSVSNPAEVEFVLSLVKYLTSTKVKPQLLGIITPYKKQKLLLQDQLRNCNLQQVDVGTVDGFQGQEKDVIIVSCVRACSSNNKIGFVADKRRMNVALTRAKYGCYVVGHMTSLRVDADWGALVDDAVKRQVVVPVKNSSVRDVLIHKVCVKPLRTNTAQKNKGLPNAKT